MALKKRSRLNRKRRSRRPLRSWQSSRLAPIFSIGGIVLVVAAFACLIIFLIIPLLSGKMNNTQASKPTPSVTVSKRDPNEVRDLTALEKEALPPQKSVNNPYIVGNEMVYSTGDKNALTPPLKSIGIYNIETKESSTLSDVSCKYNNFFEPVMNEKWAVFLDVSEKGGGRICGYDREKKKMFVIREYYYGMPKISLSGDYLAWMQQAGLTKDMLYLCHLPDNESVCLQTFTASPVAISAVDICETELIWVERADPEEEATDDLKCVIKRMPFIDGKASEVVVYDPGCYVLDPKTNGTAIVFIDGNRTADSHLKISVDGAPPKVIETGVLNYGIGSDVVAYTKDEEIFVYYIKDGLKAKLTGKNTRGELSAVCGDMVCWYDLTDDALVRDVIKYAQVPSRID